MTHCTYIYRDPKTNIIRYVGEGVLSRAHQHLRKGKKSSNPRLSAMVQKRLSEGFDLQPEVILAEDKQDGIEMEMLLISMIGREDLSSGSLFNHTDGGDGIVGYKHTAEAIKKISEASKLQCITTEQRKRGWTEGVRQTQRTKKKIHFQKCGAHPNSFGNKAKTCTIDGGKTIYKSRIALAQELGNGLSGARSKNFQYIGAQA